MNRKITTKDLALLGLLLALKIILGRYLAIDFTIVRISFAFVVNALIGYLFGPWVGAGMGAIGDILGYFGFPQTYAYFPGYTLSAAISGFVYGYFLYYKKWPTSSSLKFHIRLILAVSIVAIFCNLILGTIWTSMVIGKSFMVLLKPRMLKNILLIPVESIVLSGIFNYLGGHLRKLRTII